MKFMTGLLLLLAFSALVLFLVLTLTVPASSFTQYKRNDYRHWVDVDRDCLNTRHEVLRQESLTPPVISNCKVISGTWYDPYTGKVFRRASELDVDHFIPLAEAHRSGAWKWSKKRKREYANDLTHPDTLIAVSKSANRSKGDKDPSRWMPPNKRYKCEYIRRWVLLKRHHRLHMDSKEKNFIINSGC